MKILLIEPPYERFAGFRCEWYPMGLASIAAVCRSRGHETAVYHAEHDPQASYASIVKFSGRFDRYKQALESDDHPVWREMRSRIESMRPDVVGISVMTPKFPSARRIARLAKQINPSLIVVAGGQHPTLLPEEVLSCPDIDYAVRGEGEETFAMLLDAVKAGGTPPETIPGLSFREGAAFKHTPDRGLIQDLDRLPAPDREALLDLQTYTPVQLNMVMGSRGCPYRCGFCSSQNMWTRRVRYRSVPGVIAEIRHMRSRYNVRNITFMDDSFTVHKARVKELCEALAKEPAGLTWSCLTRVDMVSDELIRMMKRSGCTKIDIGIESGNPRVLELIRKDITLDGIRRAVQVLRRNRMFWSGFFMFGFPTETEEEVGDTLRFMQEVRPDWANISIFTPYPGTPLYDLAREKGMLAEHPDYTLYSHQATASRGTDVIPAQRFAGFARGILEQVHAYNSSPRILLKRALTRGYLTNPRLLWLDITKVCSWLKK